MSSKKKIVREKFRKDTHTRDNYTCVYCGKKYLEEEYKLLDAHHITDRGEMPGGGYVKENGISLCKYSDATSNDEANSCHMKAELFHISEGKEWNENLHPDDLYGAIGSSKEIAIIKSKKL